ncbi:MAG: HAMP domain-containing sensor histidine kinase [Acidimicrobiales bacterium]
MPRILPTRRLGLRARLTIGFALSAALLSAGLSLMTWWLTRDNLLKQRDDTAVSRVLSNAVTVSGDLQSENIAWEKLLSSLPTPEGAQPVILFRDEWHARNAVEFGQDAIPASLRAAVEAGQPSTMLYTYDGRPYLTVGVPIPAAGAAYFEGVPLEEVQKTLDGLAISLLGAAALTTLAGGLIGYLISGRALLPLADVRGAAEAIADGNLDTRMAVSGDPDLDTLSTSFNDMAQTLQDRLERDARFASEVSHELRSPLMTLSASIAVLENTRDDLPDRARTALDLMQADIDRFQQLVEDLLEISRFDVGAIKLHLEEVLVSEMVIQAVSAAGVGPVPVTYDEDVSEVVVKVDKRRFGRVIANLLDNAKKYAGGATSVQVELGPAPVDPDEPEMVRIAIEDAGHGVPEAERDIIFDRFSRGVEGGNRGADTGVGLGLALVDEHVRLHGGRVWVEDRRDRRAGARFVVELPVVPEPPPDAPAEATADHHDALDAEVPA